MIKQKKLGKMKTTKTKDNIIFWGTPELCIPYLEALKKHNYNIVAVVTNQDKPVGRKQIITSSPVKVWGETHNIPVLQPQKLDESFIQELSTYQPDLSIVVAYGKIIPENIITLPQLGTINIHYSLLPRWRGASPVEAAILSGDTETGVSIQQMVFSLDAGDVLAESKHKLTGNEFAQDMKTALSISGSELLIQSLPNILNQNIKAVPQNNTEVTKCGIIKKSDGEISLSENATTLWRKYRAYYPWPGLFFFDSKGLRIKITEAVFEQGVFIIKKIIPEGKKEISWEEYTT